eukprot:TRINITY_DN11810_c0_g1_i2.p1 TRINITY_DN11810_c0_g1~~TRINITY_DN11810_c0_g1_i2.p1  ORF type:complete len:407 (+),score=68.57 TRINITY_DN11810_c0_g1_i2:178-1398(+)
MKDSGLVSTDGILARLHRQRFARAREVTAASEHVLALFDLGGRRCVQSLALTCRTLATGVSAASSDLTARIPPKVYVAGGEDDYGNVLRDVEQLDPFTGIWEAGVPLTAPRKCCGAAALHGYVYIAGGVDCDDSPLETAERFDPWRSSWEELPRMHARRGSLCVVSARRSIVAIGGRDGDVCHASSEAFDADTFAWEMLPCMREPRYSAAAAALLGEVYVIGGQGLTDQVLSSGERLSQRLDDWGEVPELPEGRAGLAAVGLKPRIYVLNGSANDGSVLASVLSLHPEQGQWEALTPLAVARWGLGAVSLWSMILVFGGGSQVDSNSNVGACERYCCRLEQGRALTEPAEDPPRAGTFHSFSSAASSSLADPVMPARWSFIGCVLQPRKFFGAASTGASVVESQQQ